MLLPVCHVVCLAQHWDYFFHEGGTANGGNRYATVLMYLYDVEEGGETVRGEGGGETSCCGGGSNMSGRVATLA